MKILEKMKALDEIEMAKVAGGDEDYTVVDAFVEWLLSPIADALNNVAGGSDDDDRPLPFPQDRRGNKAPVEAPYKIPHIDPLSE